MPFEAKHIKTVRTLLSGVFFASIIYYVFYLVPHAFSGLPDLIVIFGAATLMYLFARYFVSPWAFDGKWVALRLIVAYGLLSLLMLALLIVISFGTGGIEWTGVGDWQIDNLNEVVGIFLLPNIYGLGTFIWDRGRKKADEVKQKDSLLLVNERRRKRINRSLRKLEKNSARLRVQMAKQDFFPHFLKNSLGAIYYLVEYDPANGKKAMKLMMQVINYYYNQGDAHMGILCGELQQLERVVEIYRLRLGFPIQLIVTLEEPMLRHREVPNTMLVNLIENCCRHGVVTDPRKPARLTIGAFPDGSMYLCLTNAIAPRPLDGKAGTGVGLQQMKDRLAAFSDSSYIKVVDDGEMFVVIVVWESED